METKSAPHTVLEPFSWCSSIYCFKTKRSLWVIFLILHLSWTVKPSQSDLRWNLSRCLLIRNHWSHFSDNWCNSSDFYLNWCSHDCVRNGHRIPLIGFGIFFKLLSSIFISFSFDKHKWFIILWHPKNSSLLSVLCNPCLGMLSATERNVKLDVLVLKPKTNASWTLFFCFHKKAVNSEKMTLCNWSHKYSQHLSRIPCYVSRVDQRNGDKHVGGAKRELCESSPDIFRPFQNKPKTHLLCMFVNVPPAGAALPHICSDSAHHVALLLLC